MAFQTKSREKFKGGKERRRGKKKKKKMRGRERCKSQGKKKKKRERKAFFGSMCESYKTVEIIELCGVKTIARRLGIKKLEYFK